MNHYDDPPGLFEALGKSYSSWKWSLANEAEIRKIRGEQQRLEALGDLLATRLEQETRCLHLAISREDARAELRFKELYRKVPAAQLIGIIEQDIEIQELLREREQIVQERRAIASGTYSLTNSGRPASPPMLTGYVPDKVLEPSPNAEQLERQALAIWSQLHGKDEGLQQLQLGNIQQQLQKQLAPYDAQTVTRRVRTLLGLMG